MFRYWNGIIYWENLSLALLASDSASVCVCVHVMPFAMCFQHNNQFTLIFMPFSADEYSKVSVHVAKLYTHINIAKSVFGAVQCIKWDFHFENKRPFVLVYDSFSLYHIGNKRFLTEKNSHSSCRNQCDGLNRRFFFAPLPARCVWILVFHCSLAQRDIKYTNSTMSCLFFFWQVLSGKLIRMKKTDSNILILLFDSDHDALLQLSVSLIFVRFCFECVCNNSTDGLISGIFPFVSSESEGFTSSFYIIFMFVCNWISCFYVHLEPESLRNGFFFPSSNSFVRSIITMRTKIK